MTTNGVPGRLVTGKGDYANRSIFLPAAGFSNGSNLSFSGSYGFYWSSTPNPDNPNYAWYFSLYSGNFRQYNYYYRYYGQPVRPVRGFAN